MDTDMNGISKKIFFSDLDGTLLTKDKRISDKTKKALDDFVSRCDYRICLCDV